MQSNIEAGTLAYDLAQLKPVIIVDANVGKIRDLDDAARELVAQSAGNRAIGMEPETECAEVMYFNLKSESTSTYTFPVTRLGVPVMNIGDYDLSPREYMQYMLLRDVMAEAVREGPDMVAEVESLFGGLSEYSDVLEAAVDHADENLSSFGTESP